MNYAQIKNGIVKNTIVLEDSSLEYLFLEGFDYFINISDIEPTPGIGWSYDGQNFQSPQIFSLED